MYNLTNLTSATTVSDVFLFANNVAAQGKLFALLSIALFFVIILMLRQRGFADALLASSWISFVISIFLVWARLLNVSFLIIYFLLVAVTSFGLTLLRRD